MTKLNYNPPIAEIDQSTDEARFNELVDRWRNDVLYISDSDEIAAHPSYQEIIQMGDVALPFIFKSLIQEPEHWFWALKSITGEDPVNDGVRGNIIKMTELWVAWGEQHGYC